MYQKNVAQVCVSVTAHVLNRQEKKKK